MFLHYFKKKENKDKKLALSIYTALIKIVELIIQKNQKNIIKDFNSSFEITSILLFSLFYYSKKNPNSNEKIIIQELLNLFIKDLDYSLRKNGIGDMNIGKYVKSYVKKFYFRVSKLEIIFENNNKEKFALFVKNLNIFYNGYYNKNISNIFYINIIHIMKRAKKQGININIFNKLFI